MTNIEELKRLAEAANAWEPNHCYNSECTCKTDMKDFQREASPDAILALISQIETQQEALVKCVEALKYLVGCSAPMTNQQKECWPGLEDAIAEAERVLE